MELFNDKHVLLKREWKSDSEDAATDAQGRAADPKEGPVGPPWAQRQGPGISASPGEGAGSAFMGSDGGSSLRELFLGPKT